MKKLIFICIMMIPSLFIIQNVDASLIVRSIYDGTINVKNGPGENYSTAGKMKVNDTFIIYNTIPIKSDSGCSEGYFKINYNGQIKYICSTYVSVSNPTVNVDWKQKINSRYGPGTNNKLYKGIVKDRQLTLLNTSKYKGTGCSKGWYKIKYNGLSNIYVCSDYTYNYIKDNKLVVNNLDGTSLRKSASSNSTKVATLKYGQALTLYSTKKYKGTGCSSGWYKVHYQNNINYVCSAYTTKTNSAYTVNYSTGVNARKKATTNSSSIKKLPYGEIVTLRSTKKYKGTGCSSGWYKIALNGSDAYACSAYLTFNHNTTNTVQSVNIRKGAGTNYSIVKNLSKDTKVILDSTKKYKGTGCSSGWYKIKYSGSNAYICSSYTELNRTPKKTTDNNTNNSTTKKTNKYKTSGGYYYTTNTWNYKVRENYAYVRSSASTASSVKDTIYLGTELNVTGTSRGNSGCSSGWYKITYYNNRTGYICKSLVNKYSEVTKNDTNYCNKLKNAGFPASYCPYLTYLHQKYPKWIFKAENTGLNFIDAVNGESYKNYTQISERPYIASTTVREAPNWRTASDGYLAYMLDPRNYLNEQNIFAFEVLSYDSNYHTKNAVRSIVDGTYLDTDEYAGYFIEAGKKYNVSPVHLASRVKQEGGSNKSYAGVSGTVSTTWNVTNAGYVCSSEGTVTKTNGTPYFKVKSGNVNVRKGSGTNNKVLTYPNGNGMTINSNDTVKILGNQKIYKTTGGCSSGWYKVSVNKSLKGIYNYYNIEAYGSNPVVRGLAAAAGYIGDLDGTPWNTRKAAIINGADFIANGYINKGQDTMYYQKFNTSPKASAPTYTHQYMTNILAPAGESLSTYESYYDLKLISKGYVFKIPVYKNMPSDYTMHPEF